MTVKTTDMTDDEALDDVCFSLAAALCDDEYNERQTRVRNLLGNYIDNSLEAK